MLRALNKEYGPDRITQSSYGFEITEEYSKETIPAHANVKPTKDPLDGISYVDNVIDWVIIKVSQQPWELDSRPLANCDYDMLTDPKGQEIPFHAEYPLEVWRTFSTTRKNYICKETLWVSDTCTESHYRTTHKMNKGSKDLALMPFTPQTVHSDK